MDNVNQVSAPKFVANISSRVAQYLPQPASTGVGMFQDVMDMVKAVGSGITGGVEQMGVGNIQDLLNQQMETQLEMQTISLTSNIERSKHEAKMAAIRNIRVG